MDTGGWGEGVVQKQDKRLPSPSPSWQLSGENGEAELTPLSLRPVTRPSVLLLGYVTSSHPHDRSC